MPPSRIKAGGTRRGPKAGGINAARKNFRQGVGADTRKVSSGSAPIVRSGSGGLELRGGTRGNWKRDMLGRFA